MLAVVFGALAPTLAQAMVAATNKAQWVEVCSASGMVWLKADGSDATGLASTPGAPMSDAAQHCPWCSFHGASPGLPPGTALPLPTVSAEHAVPPWALVVSPGPTVRGASARGPPLSA